MMETKKIGFADFYLSEWHANHYPAWIEQACANLGLSYKVAYGWAELEVSPLNQETTAQWCSRMGAEKCDTLEELCEKSDVIIVLAPSNPEKHLGYAQKVLPYGKLTYIDKTFAPDLKTAEEIYRIADESHAVIFSSSALRYASELAGLKDIRKLTLRGSGRSFEEYIIHLAEMAVKVLGTGICDAAVEQKDGQSHCRIRFENGTEAQLLFDSKLPYAFSAEDKSGIISESGIESEYFLGLIEDMLRFFETGKPSFERDQTLAVISMRDMLLDGYEKSLA